MLRGLCIVGMRIRIEAIPYAPGVVYPRNAPSLWGFPECSEGCVPSECTFGLKLSRMLRDLLTLGVHPHFEAIPRAPRVAYPRNALSL